MADTPFYSPAPGTETEPQLKKTARHDLRPGYPEDLSRSSEPAQGSIGDGSLPIKNREAPWKGLKGGK